MQLRARKHILVTAVYFLVVAVITLAIIRFRNRTGSSTSQNGCNDEDYMLLNQTVTGIKAQIDLMREHRFAARRQQIEDRERLRYESKYYKSTKKLAICFSGFLRSFNLTEDRILKELFGLFGEDNIDIFMFVPQVVNNGNIQPLPNISWPVTAIEAYQQQDLPQPASGSQYHYRSNFQGWLQQVYGLHGCYNMIHEHQERTRTKYEWVARARPDVVYFYDESFQESFTLANLDSTIWWIPDNQHWDGANDKFMLSSNTNFELYANFDNIYYYTGLYKPEIYHKVVVEQYGINIGILTNFTTKIVREDGSYWPW
jgi:hypothetical protein